VNFSLPLRQIQGVPMIKKPFLTALILSALSLTSLQGRVEAAEFLTGVEVLIGPDEVLNEDVYVFAGRVVIDGTINGDLVAAGETIEVNGRVNGDLIVAARSIMVNGVVEDDIRAAGSNLQFLSLIGGDLITAGDEIKIESDSVIGNDLVASANTLIARGDVEGNLDLSVVEARIEGAVQGNVDATVEERLILGPESVIAGELTYTSLNNVTMQSGAEVVGEVTKQVPMINVFGNEFQVSTFIQVVSQIISQTKWFIGTLFVGLILIWVFPATMHNVSITLSKSPWKSFFMGVIVLPMAPVVFFIIMIVALSIVGFSAFPIVAVPAAVYASMLLLAKPAIAVSIGGYVAKRVTKREDFTLRSALVIGAAVLAGIGLIPYVKSIVGWLTLLLGFGMWLLFIYRHYREARVTQSA
jgi:cytoskeletal protein CcmA (bactofilin family)